MKIETWDLLTMRTEALAYMWNTTESEVRARRLAHTGHGHVLSAKWAITIGSWGRVRSAAVAEAIVHACAPRPKYAASTKASSPGRR